MGDTESKGLCIMLRLTMMMMLMVIADCREGNSQRGREGGKWVGLRMEQLLCCCVNGSGG